MLESFEQCDLSTISPLILKNLALTICGKISICVNAKIVLGKHVQNLMQFFIKNNLVNKVFQGFLMEQIKKIKEEENMMNSFKIEDIKEEESLYASENEFKVMNVNKAKPHVDNHLKEALYQMLNISEKAEKYTKKHFGYSLLDLQGNIIWADANSCTLLDLQKKDFAEEEKVNFFDLMIPMSKKYLHMKFGEQFFADSKEVGASKAFSYVIYSRTAMQNCLRSFKKKNISDPDRFRLNNKENYHMEVFTRYLKSVSSRASLIMLSFSKAKLNSILKSDKCEMQISKNLIKKMINEVKPFKQEKETPENLKLFVFLETRLSSGIPNFDYSVMKDDPQILIFNETIKTSLKEFAKKQRENYRKKFKKDSGGKKVFKEDDEAFSEDEELKEEVNIRRVHRKRKKIKKKEKNRYESKEESESALSNLDLSYLERRRLKRIKKLEKC
jgi:hypothetical protein